MAVTHSAEDVHDRNLMFHVKRTGNTCWHLACHGVQNPHRQMQNRLSGSAGHGIGIRTAVQPIARKAAVAGSRLAPPTWRYLRSGLRRSSSRPHDALKAKRARKTRKQPQVSSNFACRDDRIKRTGPPLVHRPIKSTSERAAGEPWGRVVHDLKDGLQGDSSGWSFT